jgi:hypothetical protein
VVDPVTALIDVFSVQHLFCSFRWNAILVSRSGPLDASLEKTGAESFGKQSILRTSAARRARMLCGIYFP